MCYKVYSIDSFLTYDWLLYKHYAKRIPSISFAFGLYDENNLMQGVITFGKPPSPPLCDGVCGVENRDYVYELNRLCVNEGLPKNTLSFFVSQSLKMLPDLIIVSYADTSQGHKGYIYQATNWIYTGLSAKRTERYDPNNPNKHSKTLIDSNKVKYEDLAIRERPQKHRYIYFTGSKKHKKRMLKSLNYEIKEYPKGENNRYDASYNPNVQMLLF